MVLDGKREVIEFYENGGDYFVFDTVGHCYRTHSEYDVVETLSQEVVDTDQIRSPMPGVVVQINVEAGQAVEKVKKPVNLGHRCGYFGSDENGAYNCGQQ